MNGIRQFTLSKWKAAGSWEKTIRPAVMTQELCCTLLAGACRYAANRVFREDFHATDYPVDTQQVISHHFDSAVLVYSGFVMRYCASWVSGQVECRANSLHKRLYSPIFPHLLGPVEI